MVRVSAQLDYDTRETTREVYLSSPAVTPLSEATSREVYGKGAAGVGGQLGVISPTLTPYAPGASGQDYLKEERTVNNAVGKELVTEKAAPGAVERLSIAVVLDATTLGATDTARVQAIVASAAGVDADRGDVVQVDKLPFDTASVEAAKAELDQGRGLSAHRPVRRHGPEGRPGPARRDRRHRDDDPAQEVRPGLGGRVGLRPARRRADAVAARGDRGAATPRARPGAGRRRRQPGLEREKMRDEVASFVDSQPEEIAQLVQGWLSQRSN